MVKLQTWHLHNGAKGQLIKPIINEAFVIKVECKRWLLLFLDAACKMMTNKTTVNSKTNDAYTAMNIK